MLSYFKYDIIKLAGGPVTMTKIKNIISGSTADKAGIKADDKIVKINGQEIKDYIDYLYEISEPFISLQLKRNNGQIEEIEIERELGKELGIEFKEIIFDGLKQCANNCIFCFVKQQPQNLRASLNQKDDDYRFSFLQGSFITLTNLKTAEIERIITQNLSPLNISVHTTNPELRVAMMKNPRAAEIKKLLTILAENGIEFHTQIVLCPGYNDQKELDKTLSDLLNYYPALLSIGIVPVGLTCHRQGLADLRILTKQEKRAALKQIKYWQNKARTRYGENLIYAADEFYLETETKLPGLAEYNGFPQLENGIGLTALLESQFAKLNLPNNLTANLDTLLLTSKLGKKSIINIVNKLNEINNFKLELAVISNRFFGDTVTVTGLLTAQDIKNKLLKIDPQKYDKIFIPAKVLNDDQKFLDGVTKVDFLTELADYQLKFINNFEELVEVIKNG